MGSGLGTLEVMLYFGFIFFPQAANAALLFLALLSKRF